MAYSEIDQAQEPTGEPLDCYSPRNPAAPWLAVEEQGDFGDEHWARHGLPAAPIAHGRVKATSPAG